MRLDFDIVSTTCCRIRAAGLTSHSRGPASPYSWTAASGTAVRSTGLGPRQTPGGGARKSKETVAGTETPTRALEQPAGSSFDFGNMSAQTPRHGRSKQPFARGENRLPGFQILGYQRHAPNPKTRSPSPLPEAAVSSRSRGRRPVRPPRHVAPRRRRPGQGCTRESPPRASCPRSARDA